MNYKSISFYLSLFCFPISFLAFINILYASYFDYFLSIDTYFTTLLISFFVGVGLWYYGKSAIASNWTKVVFLSNCDALEIRLAGLVATVIKLGEGSGDTRRQSFHVTVEPVFDADGRALIVSRMHRTPGA